MVKKIVQRVIVGVLVSLILGLIYGVSQTNALTMTMDAVPTGRSLKPITFNCKYNYTGWAYNQDVCALEILGSEPASTTFKGIQAIEVVQEFDFKKNHYYEFYLLIGASSIQNWGAITWYPVVNNEDWALVEYTQVTEEQTRVHLTDNNIASNSGTAFTRLFRVVMMSKKDRTGKFMFGNGENTVFLVRTLAAGIMRSNFSIGLITEYEGLSVGEQMQQDKEENQQQGQQSQDDADATAQETEQKTQNLLGFLGSFFGAFTSAQATNCNMDWGLSEYGFGVIDMCSTDIPAQFTVILSIITLLVVLPMVLWLIYSIINAFKEFQE